MSGMKARQGSAVLLVLVAAVLGACGSRTLYRAPVEDRANVVGKAQPESAQIISPAATMAPAGSNPPPQGAENAGKAGYYTVKPGDTLIHIALEHGQSVRDIARWSGVDNPNRIEVGQVLRIEPPTQGAVVTRPVTIASAVPVAAAPGTPSSPSKAGPTVAPAPPESAATGGTAPAAGAPDDGVTWVWPTAGSVIAGFDEVKNKGVDIGGVAGEAVVAAADGRVVYVGAGLRGYGNLIILKHNNTYLSAYAHNQTLLVKEDQSVRRGQKIAEMGSSDADRVKLHFEVRRQGKPVDPIKYLPAR